MTFDMEALDMISGEGYSALRGDCVDVMRQLPDCSIDLSVYSPPFSSLYIFSDSICDMGNVESHEQFFEQYGFALRELHRITRPGRVTAVHVKDLPTYKGSHGFAGVYEFSDDVVKAHRAAGWVYTGRLTIWRDPVKEQRKTKTQRLNYKDLRADSCVSGVGMPEYVLYFRRWPHEGEELVPVTHVPESFPLSQWQEWASPVWMTCRETDVLNVKIAAEAPDEKHLTPMPLDITERIVIMKCNPGDIVLSPFMGIGSEGVVALRNKRRFIGIELKESYYRYACRYLSEAARSNITLLDRLNRFPLNASPDSLPQALP